MNHLNDAFWMSIRLGTSRIFSSLENVLRTRGEVVSGKANASRGAYEGRYGWAWFRTNGATEKPIRAPVSRKQVGLPTDAAKVCRAGNAWAHYTEGGAPRQARRATNVAIATCLCDNERPASNGGQTPCCAAGWPSPTFSGWWQAATWPSPWSTSGGSSVAQISVA